MVITNRELPVGTRLVADYKKQSYVCTVEAGDEGKLAFVVDDKRHTSPSAAGSAVMGGTACNGWRFWTVEGQAAPKAEKPAKREAQPKVKVEKAPKASRKPRAAKKFKLFDAMPDGRIWCKACQAPFDSADENPEVCPQGHRADDAELTSAPAPEAVSAEREAVEA